MSKLYLSIVQLEKIHCDKPRRDFSETTLETAARLILASGGIITPLILRRIKDDFFELVNGYFEYYAAVKACELEPIKGDSIDAYVIEANNQSIMEAQVKMFRDFQMNTTSVSTTSATDSASTSASTPEETYSAVEQSLTQHIETVLTPLFNQWAHQLQENLTQTLTHQVPTIIQSLLVPINQQLNELTQRLAKLEEKGLTGKTITAPLPQSSPATDSPLLIALEQLSDIELQEHCKKAGINQHKIIDAILAKRREQPFRSEKELRDTKNVGKKTVDKLVDYFAQTPIQLAPEISSAIQVTLSSTVASEISPPLENEQEAITPPSESESSPIQPASEISPAIQVTPHSSNASEISPPLENEQEPITPPSELEPSPIQPASEISPAIQVTPQSTHASEISPPLENEQEPITPPNELESSPVQPISEISQATQVTQPSTLASEISPPLESEQEPITPPNELEQSPIQPTSEISQANQVTPSSTVASESELTPLETSSPVPKTSPPSASLTEEEQLLVTINNLGSKELIFELNRAKVKEEVIETILKQRPFASIQAIIKIRGVGKRKWETIKKSLKNKN